MGRLGIILGWKTRTRTNFYEDRFWTKKRFWCFRSDRSLMMGAEIMKKLFLALFVFSMILLGHEIVFGDSLYPIEGTSSVYTEKRARRVGDVITVMIQETNNATNSASSQDQKSGSLVVGAGTGFLGSTNFLNNNINQNIGLGGGVNH